MKTLFLWILLTVLFLLACTPPFGHSAPVTGAGMTLEITCHSNCSLQLILNGTMKAPMKSLLTSHCALHTSGSQHKVQIVCPADEWRITSSSYIR